MTGNQQLSVPALLLLLIVLGTVACVCGATGGVLLEILKGLGG